METWTWRKVETGQTWRKVETRPSQSVQPGWMLLVLHGDQRMCLAIPLLSYHLVKGASADQWYCLYLLKLLNKWKYTQNYFQEAMWSLLWGNASVVAGTTLEGTPASVFRSWCLFVGGPYCFCMHLNLTVLSKCCPITIPFQLISKPITLYLNLVQGCEGRQSSGKGNEVEGMPADASLLDLMWCCVLNSP